MAQFPIDKFKTIKTPFYYYDMDLLEATLLEIRLRASVNDRFNVHYAVKANANPTILKTVSAAGLGADCVSGGEIAAAIDAGFAPEKIVYAGVGKTDDEILYALNTGIGCFNVESIPELEVISQLASSIGKKAKIALRVNPDIDAHTHEYITTGLAENKFGIDMSMLDCAVEKALGLEGVELTGFHFHIGSQITITEPFVVLCERINRLVERYSSRGVKFTSLNVGGGLGIDYENPDLHPIADFKSYFDTFNDHLNLPQGCTLHFELGRAVVAQCGSVISRVIFVKEGVKKRFAIIDAGMNDLLRPALYGAHHKIQSLTADSSEMERYDVVGPICESSDIFGKDELLPKLHRGDLMALRSAGAYGETMASCYNLRPLPRSEF